MASAPVSAAHRGIAARAYRCRFYGYTVSTYALEQSVVPSVYPFSCRVCRVGLLLFPSIETAHSMSLWNTVAFPLTALLAGSVFRINTYEQTLHA